MGLSLDPNLSLSGYRIASFKEALRGFARTQWRGSVINLESVFPLRKDGAIVLEECIDRGLIDPATLTITEVGMAVARAKLRPRTSLSKAQSVLVAFLDHFDVLSRDENVVRCVDEAWLFGSVLREQETVGDIDLALTFFTRPSFAGDYEKIYAHVDAMLAGYEKAPQASQDPWDKKYWLDYRQLFGARRAPMLAGVQEGTIDLASMGEPCRLIYDAKRGGRVFDPVLPRHPSSTGRDPRLGPPAQLPDFTPAAIRPMDARWVAAFRKTGGVNPFDMFRGDPKLVQAWFPHHSSQLCVFADDHDTKYAGWKPARLRRPGLDGRDAVCIVNTLGSRGASLVLNRYVGIQGNRWVLTASFSDAQAYRTRGGVDAAVLRDIAAIAAIILAADFERITRRAAELTDTPSIEVHIERSDERSAICFNVANLVEAYLQRERVLGVEVPVEV